MNLFCMKRTFTKKFFLRVFIGLLPFVNGFCKKADAQFVSIPDPHFVYWLNNNGFASCMSGNSLDTTCSAVINATSLNVGYGNISDLTGIQYFHNLDTLKCGSNSNLINIPNLPSSLLYLDFSYDNSLTSLPILPPGLIFLECTDCFSLVLPNFPTSLQYLFCSYSHLFNPLSSLPPGLIQLGCQHTNLSFLPDLPSTLISLQCDYNSLNYLPNLPNALLTLTCSHNGLSNIPTFHPRFSF